MIEENKAYDQIIGNPNAPIINQLARTYGLASNYYGIIFNQCNEMHGLARCPNLERLIATGDARVGETVRQITNSPLWKSAKNNAIVITWDEDDGSPKPNPACCGYNPKSTV